MSSLKTSVVLVALEKVVLTLAGFSISVILARTMGPAGMGDWRLLMSAQNISVYILGLGMALVVTRYTAEYVKDLRFGALTVLFRRALIIMIGVVIGASGLFLTIVYGTDSNFELSLVSQGIAIMVAAALSLNLINDIVGRAFFAGLRRRDIVAVVQMIGRGFLFIAVTCGWFLERITIEVAVMFLVIAYSIELILYSSLLFKRRKQIFKADPDETLTADESRRMAGFAGFQWLFRMTQLLREYSVDNYMLLAFKGVETVGIYGAAVTMPLLIRGFSPAKLFAGILIPNLVPKREHLGVASFERFSFFFTLIQKITIISVWPVVTIGFVYAPEIIVGIFGNSFIDAVPAMRILIAFMLIQTAADIFYNFAISLEESRMMFLTSLWGIANVVINLLLIPIWDATGAAIGTGVVSIGIYLHFRISLAKKGFLFYFPWRCGLRAVMAMVPLLIFIVSDMAVQLPVVEKSVCVLVTYLVYLVLLRHFSPFNLEENRLINDRFGQMSFLLVKPYRNSL